MPTPNRFAAVDTGVLLALEAGDEEAQECIDLLNKAGFYCIVTETPLQELAHICETDSDEEIRRHARQTLVQITNFGFVTPSLTSVQMGVAEQVAQKLIDKYILQGVLNDGLALAEAAYQKCRMFVTRRKSILATKRDSIRIFLVDFDLAAVVVTSPADLVKYFGQ